MERPKMVKELPPAPKGVQDWILKDVVKGKYIIYSNKENRAICTYCKKEYKLNELTNFIPAPKHNSKTLCPNCAEDVICKSKNVGRKNLTEMTRVMIVVRKGKSIYVTVSEIDISFNEELPKIDKWIQSIYKFNSNEQSCYRHYYSWYYGEAWREVINIKIPTVPNAMGWPAKRQGVHVYEKNLNKVFNNTDLKYADTLKVYKDKKLDAEDLLQYIYLSAKFQSVEILRKSGFWSLIKSKIYNHRGSRSINWKAKDLRKILGLNMAEIRKIRDEDFEMWDLQIYKRQMRAGTPVGPKEIELIRYYYGENIEEYVTLGKAARYIVKQKEKYKNACEINFGLNDYDDYIQQCVKLGFDLIEKKTLFPQNFIKEHDRLTKIIRKMKEEANKKAFKETQLKITGMTEPYIADGYLIRPAKSEKELRREGQSLGHCVGDYGDYVAEGTGAILFIRKVDKPNKSFYTLDLTNKKKIRQCQGKGRCPMTEEVRVFVDKWHQEVIMKKTKKIRKEVLKAS